MACANLGIWPWSPDYAQPQAEPVGQAKVEFQDPVYDGSSLSGRLLIGVESGHIRLDKRLIENVSVEVSAVSDCDTGQQIGYILFDHFSPPPEAGDLLVLEPGAWYGTDFHYTLFDERLSKQPIPECVNVTLLLRSFDGADLARTAVHARRKSPVPPPQSDAGTPAPLPDAGMQAP